MLIKRKQGGELYVEVKGEAYELGIKVGDNDPAAIEAACKTMVELAAYSAQVEAAQAALAGIQKPAGIAPAPTMAPTATVAPSVPASQPDPNTF